MAVSKIVDQIKELSDEDFKEVFVKAMEQNRPASLKKSISKTLERKSKAIMKLSGRGEVPAERDTSGCSLNQPTPTTSKETSVAAFQSPFIFRGDLIPKEKGYLFFDVEKLSLKPQGPEQKHKMVASSVGVVNKNNDAVLWSFIKWKNVCQTFPALTGITKEKLEIGLDINLVKPFLEMAFQGNTVVGWDMDHDLTALFLDRSISKLDLADYFVDDDGKKYRLKDAWIACMNHYKMEKKDTIQCGVHSALQDARATRDLYNAMLKLKEDFPDKYRCPIKVSRSPKEPFAFNKNDRCQCKKNKYKKPMQNVFFLPE